MNRRGFLKRIGAAVIGLTLARELPGIAPTLFRLAPPRVVDANVGIAVRFVKQWDVVESRMLSRFDAFVALPDMSPECVVRVEA